MRYRKALNGLERNNEKMSVGLNDHGHFCLLRKNYFCLHLNLEKKLLHILHNLHISQLHKFNFEFFRLCGLQFCECASFTAVRKFHRRVAHLSSLRACFVITVKKYQIYVQKCSFSLKNPIAVVKNSLNQVLLCVSFANFCASSWEKANGSLWPPPHLNAMAY